MVFFVRHTTGWKLVFSVTLMLAIATSHADTSDWVQVERFQHLSKQASGGKTSAMYDLGRLYERGTGTQLDYKQAAKWYRQASAAGYAPATARLGILYFEGRGVPQDHGKAYQLLSKAAASNVPEAQYQLALMYEWGTVVEQDRDKALYWYRKAAKGGDYRAKAKAKQLASKSASPPARPAVHRRAKTTAGIHPLPTLALVLKTHWKHANKPASYLPSAVSQCNTTAPGTAKCRSRKQVRNTPSEIITFDTVFTLSNVRNKEFTVQYEHTIVDVQARDTTADAMDEEESTVTDSQVKIGQKSKPRKLRCRLINRKLLRCTRDRIYSYDFHG